jgi:hypothetical protein
MLVICHAWMMNASRLSHQEAKHHIECEQEQVSKGKQRRYVVTSTCFCLFLGACLFAHLLDRSRASLHTSLSWHVFCHWPYHSIFGGHDLHSSFATTYTWAHELLDFADCFTYVCRNKRIFACANAYTEHNIRSCKSPRMHTRVEITS